MKLLLLADNPNIVNRIGKTIDSHCRSVVSLISVDQASDADLILLAAYPGETPVLAARNIRNISEAPMYVITEAIDVHAASVFHAMGIGALDVIEFSIQSPHSGQKTSLCGLIDKYAVQPGKTKNKPCIWLIGSSSGGPETLCALLGQVPVNPLLSILVVQHVDSQFDRNMIAWLNKKLEWPVCVAEEGRAPVGGKVFLPAGDEQLGIADDGCFHYQEPGDNTTYHPSIDQVFLSFATHWKRRGCASILTGMGDDGAIGLLALESQGFDIAVQKPDSCKIDAMPRAVLQRKSEVRQLDLSELAQWVNQVTVESVN